MTSFVICFNRNSHHALISNEMSIYVIKASCPREALVDFIATVASYILFDVATDIILDHIEKKHYEDHHEYMKEFYDRVGDHPNPESIRLLVQEHLEEVVDCLLAIESGFVVKKAYELM